MRVRFDPLLEGPGPRSRRSNRDSEGLLVDGDRLWITFERRNMIWRYDRASLRAQSAARPESMRRWLGNSGAEALVRLADGRFLVLGGGQGRRRGPVSDAILFAGDAATPDTPAIRLRYRRPDGFRVTDAALLPDGRILILNRRFAWLRFSARLTLADPRAAGGGRDHRSERGGDARSAAQRRQYGGARHHRENGRTIVWIASDDDFMAIVRRTLLLKFELRL